MALETKHMRVCINCGEEFFADRKPVYMGSSEEDKLCDKCLKTLIDQMTFGIGVKRNDS